MSITCYTQGLQVNNYFLLHSLAYFTHAYSLMLTHSLTHSYIHLISVSGGKGCLINARFTNPPSVNTKWWTKPPTIAGETANDAQIRLNSLVSRYQLLYNQFDHIIKVFTIHFYYIYSFIYFVLRKEPINVDIRRQGDTISESMWRKMLRES